LIKYNARYFFEELIMQALKKQLKQNLAWVLFSTVFAAYQPALAVTDTEAQESFLKARAKAGQQNEHAGHDEHADHSLDFHGVFMGFVPCNDCLGIKMTLSLNQNKNYSLVVQYARPGARETYEKGKYEWNEDQQRVTLTPRKNKGEPRQFHIENGETLILLNEDGARMTGSEAARYELHKSDTMKNREFHFH
jgi:uncharacterized lipoprotein NlpE involved in copper resistance